MNEVVFAIGVMAGVGAVFVGWLADNWRKERKNRDRVTLGVPEVSAHSEPQAPHTRIGVLEVMNGKLLEVCSFKRNPHGPDWMTTYWILNDEQPLAEQIAVVMAMKGLEK